MSCYVRDMLKHGSNMLKTIRNMTAADKLKSASTKTGTYFERKHAQIQYAGDI